LTLFGYSYLHSSISSKTHRHGRTQWNLVDLESILDPFDRHYC
jgi:hypothetical protein